MPTVNPDLIPAYDMLGLPMPALIAQLLMALMLALHWAFLAATAGGAIAYFTAGRSSLASVAGKDLAGLLPFTLSMAMTLGIAPLLFVQVLYGNFFYTSNILMGYVWLGLLVVVIITFYLLFLALWQVRRGRSAALAGVLVLLLLGVSAKILTANATLAQSPQAWQGFSAAGGTLPYLGDAVFWPRWLFALSVLIAGGGLFIALYLRLRTRTQDTAASGGVWRPICVSIIGMIGLLVCGLWASRTLPDAVRSSLLRSWESVFAYVSTAAFLLALFLLIVSLVKPSSSPLRLSAVVFFLGLFSTAALRDTLRRIALSDHLKLSDLAVHPQWASMVLFLVVFVLGLGLVAYMAKLALVPKSLAKPMS